VVHELDAMLHTGRGGPTEEQSPFRGLLPFGEQHAALFFGRETELDVFLERVREQAVLPVVGPTGAGKSSFIQAGVIPRLREQAADSDGLGLWNVLRLRPGTQPFRALAARLLSGETTARDSVSSGRRSLGLSETSARAPLEDEDDLARRLYDNPRELNLQLHQMVERESSRVLLFVDQLEELCTLGADEEVRRRFMEALCAAADDPQDPVRVIFALREDFLGRVVGGPIVREALSRLTMLWSPGADALEDILTRPLLSMGYGYDDPELVQEMVAAVEGEPSSLPLLQFTGRLLWERRDRKRRLLLRSAYDAIGGVAGALARHADGVLQGLSTPQLHTARELLLRLVTPEGTRRVVGRDQLLSELDTGEAVLGPLVQGRLIHVRKTMEEDGPRLELAHESLIRTWATLARWIEESREELIFLKEVGQAAELWLRRGQREEEVWRGEALHEARRTLKRCTTQVPGEVRSFIDAGLRREQRRLRRRRLLLAALIIIPTLVALLFIVKERETRTQRDRAAAGEREARERWAEAQREGARAALAQRALLEARAKMRASLEREDSLLARVLWWRLEAEPLLWSRELGDGIFNVAFTRDGRTLAAAGQDRSIYLFDPRTARVRVLRGHQDQVFAVTFAPDGRLLASGGWGGDIRLWRLDLDPRRPQKPRVLSGHKGGVRRLAFSPDGRRLASAGLDKTIRIWDPATGKTRRTLVGHTDGVYGVVFSPDGKLLASASRDKTVRVWQSASGELVHVLKGHSHCAEGLAFSPEGGLLASGSWDATIRLWDPVTGRLRRVLSGHTANVGNVAFTPDGRWLASGSWDKTIRIWDVASGQTRHVLRGHKGGLYAMALGPRGRLVASGSWDKSIRVWDRSRLTGSAHGSRGHTGSVYGVGFSPDGALLATGSADRSVRIWDVASGTTRRVLTGHGNMVEGVAFSPDGSLVASASADRSVRVWDQRRGIQTRVFAGHQAEITGVAFSPDGKLVASGGLDTTVRLWDLAGGRHRVLAGHTGGVRSVAFSPDGKLLASGGGDKTARLWSVSTGRPVRVLEGHQGQVYGVAFSPDGKLLATGSEDGALRVFDVRSGRDGRVVGRMDGRVYIIAFHPGGRIIGAPCSNGTARLFNLEDKSSVLLAGHGSEVNYLAFSPDGKLVATTSDDGTVRLFEVESGHPRWRAPLLLTDPPRLLTGRGWIGLKGKEAPAPTVSRARALEERALRGAVLKRRLCSLTHDGELEAWDLSAWRLLFRVPAPRSKQVLAVPDGCLLLTREGAAVLHTRAGKRVLHAREASAATWDGRAILIAVGDRLHRHAPDGATLGSQVGRAGVTALLQGKSHVLLGFRDGTIERLDPRSGRWVSFEGTPSGAVVSLELGPRQAVVAAGFASGSVGLWDLRAGSRLHLTRMHGPVRHLKHVGGTLFAASDLGQHLSLDLGALRIPYCKLLRQVWHRVPVIWDEGKPVERGPPRDHRCQRRQ
jgi:WD40 repeat protein